MINNIDDSSNMLQNFHLDDIYNLQKLEIISANIVYFTIKNVPYIP